jgi:DEAD/DEAH box helicase domain-containing protein
MFYFQGRFQLESLPERWDEFRAFILSTSEYLSRFLAGIPAVEVQGSRLILQLQNGFYRDWLTDEENRVSLRNLIRQYVATPSSFHIDYQCPEEGDAQANAKIAKMYTDLTGRRNN